MTIEQKYKKFIDYFSKHNPNPKIELNYKNPYQLLVATILSAQCTDKRVNLTTPALFKKFPTPKSLAYRSFDEVYPYIKSITFPNNKTKYLISMSTAIVEKFGGKIPEDEKDLQTLAGVGRKSAHVLAANLHKKPAMVVDTHVNRVSKRIGLVSERATTPLAVEKELIKHIPKDIIYKSSHWLVLHGRYICTARSPKCDICPISDFCLYYSNL